jgi:hypothetical protein
MGMFDYFKSSYPLPEAFTGICQTKDIEDFDIGGSLSNYWLDPSGYLWCGDYAGTSTLEVYEEGDPKYNPEFKWQNWEWIPTGIRGKWHVHPITKYIVVYPAQWGGKWEDWPRLRLHFKSGKLQDFTEVTGQ